MNRQRKGGALLVAETPAGKHPETLSQETRGFALIAIPILALVTVAICGFVALAMTLPTVAVLLAGLLVVVGVLLRETRA